ncbi:MAG: C45 family autoproteolytic acyltransferase/hydrolase, partial [Pseudorhodobacter sp.]
AEVMAWNCRGDLLASVPDGCTSLLYPGRAPELAHNEDGLPFLRGHCGIVEACPDGAAAFVAFCYPGSIPGHTFAATAAGLLQTVNNMRLTGVRNAGLPRMVLGRAVLSQNCVAAAIDMLQAHPAAGGFHFALADAQGVQSVEFGAGMVSVRPVGAPAAHANHALHLDLPQRITVSSHDRQARAEALLADRPALDILLDREGPGLPIHRSDADDPEEENTLGTAVLKVAGGVVHWEVHDGAGGPVHSGRIATG